MKNCLVQDRWFVAAHGDNLMYIYPSRRCRHIHMVDGYMVKCICGSRERESGSVAAVITTLFYLISYSFNVQSNCRSIHVK